MSARGRRLRALVHVAGALSTAYGAALMRSFALCVLASLLTACTAQSGERVANVQPDRIAIDADNGLFFQPLLRTPADALTPEEAWARWAQHGHPVRPRIPPGMHVQYGRFDGEAAYGFSLPHMGCGDPNPFFPPPNVVDCTNWTFLDPHSGDLIVFTQQPIFATRSP